MNKKERHEYIMKTAREMAASGKYRDYLGIEVVLRRDGFHEARSLLDSRSIREELKELCNEAQSKKGS
jgi:hypothetical protein